MAPPDSPPVLASLFHLDGSGLPCMLTSLMDLERVVDFSVCSVFHSLFGQRGSFQASYKWNWKPESNPLILITSKLLKYLCPHLLVATYFHIYSPWCQCDHRKTALLVWRSQPCSLHPNYCCCPRGLSPSRVTPSKWKMGADTDANPSGACSRKVTAGALCPLNLTQRHLIDITLLFRIPAVRFMFSPSSSALLGHAWGGWKGRPRSSKSNSGGWQIKRWFQGNMATTVMDLGTVLGTAGVYGRAVG